MDFANILDAALPLAAVMVPAFVLGFGAIWLAVHNGLTDMRKELHIMAERVARIEGRLDPHRPVAGA
ncbi:MAG: hypothetical protein OYH76_07075 [Defluviicoccus sp.]|nr:hypothetical protein [Defluviicoccus sp.]MDE0275640.1 hypothetical protein [Defluviicoccus sp.]